MMDRKAKIALRLGKSAPAAPKPKAAPPAKPAADKPLTAKQSLFVSEYLIDLNATQAAIRAGYAKGSAQQTGARIMSIDVVSQAIAKVQQARAQRTGITADDIVKGLKGFAEDDTVSKKDRIKSYELLGKNIGMFNTIKLLGDPQNPITVTKITRVIVDAPQD